MSTRIPAASKPRVHVIGSVRDELTPLPFGHVAWPSTKEAEAIFLWTGDEPKYYHFFRLGEAAAQFKPIYWADGGASFPFPLEGLRIIKRGSSITVRGAYETLMADLDVTLPSVDIWSWITAHEEGKCAGCGSIYEKFMGIAKVQKAGGTFYYHRDCYDRITDPQTVNAALITDRLVEALRKDNARLQHELEELKKESHADDRVRLRGGRTGKR